MKNEKDIKNNYSTDKLLEGIVEQNPKILTYIYKTYYPQVRSLVIRNNGNENDAKDIFQNSIIAVYKSAAGGKLELSVQFGTYLVAVAHKMWLKQLKRRSIVEFKSIETMKNSQLEEFTVGTDDADKHIQYLENFQLYQRVFELLSIDCQIMLRMFYDKISMTKIAQYFGLKSPEQAKKKKLRCKENLIEMIKNSPDCNLDNE